MTQPHRARKRFGQNFLHDQAVINRIVTAIDPQPEQTLLEIGPGLGAITAPLLQAAGKVNAVEIDRDLIAQLPAAMAPHGELTLHEQDALKLNLKELLPDSDKVRVVGNLPYNISTPLLFHLCDQIDRIQDMHFMLQKEVVERMAAGPGSKTYGRLSVMLQYHCQVVPLFIVKAGAFNPPPKVESAIIRLKPHPTAPFQIGEYAQFQKLVTQCFSQRRKTLRNAVNGIATLEDLEAVGLDPTARPETLYGEDFGKLSHHLCNN
jgi:16S rRNA (adenine1518-N6/adenine1519-N6)-dimethyltransferase